MHLARFYINLKKTHTIFLSGGEKKLLASFFKNNNELTYFFPIQLHFHIDLIDMWNLSYSFVVNLMKPYNCDLIFKNARFFLVSRIKKNQTTIKELN